MAGVYHGHLLEFPLIRVDCFTAPPLPPRQPWLLPDPQDPDLPPRPAPNAQLYLLTHVHTDHLTGLSSDFTGKIICSPDTKRMLLRLEAESDRKLSHYGYREVTKRKYEGLSARSRVVGAQQHVVDMITINEGETRDYLLGYEGGQEIRVSITLLDANHCPGSSMFLITSPKAAVLHTGDVRADRTFLRSLRRMPVLQKFFVPWYNTGYDPYDSRLDRIYLDTSALFKGDMPEREEVLKDLMRYMSIYPRDTVFFLDVWCFGWEYVVEEVSRHFGAPVHVDRYKRGIYAAIRSNPFLVQCTTEDPDATRFHACERWFRCGNCREGHDRLVVQVKMVEVDLASWDMHQQMFLTELNNAAMGDGAWPSEISIPLARHSLIPELQELVALFRPSSISPNTLVPDHGGRDFFLLSAIFKDCIDECAQQKMVKERDYWFAASPLYGPRGLQALKQEASDIALVVQEKPSLHTKIAPARNAHAAMASNPQQHTLTRAAISRDEKPDMSPKTEPDALIPDAVARQDDRNTGKRQRTEFAVDKQHLQELGSRLLKK